MAQVSMSETMTSFPFPFCSFSSFSCLKAPLREMREKTFTPPHFSDPSFLLFFFQRKWDVLPGSLIVETFSSIISLGCNMSSSSCHQCCQPVSLLSTWTLSSIFSLLLPSFLSLSSGKSITRVPPSHLCLLPNPSSFYSISPRAKLTVQKGQLSPFPALRVWEEGRNIWSRLYEWRKRRSLRVLQFQRTHTVYICNYYHAMYFWVRLRHIMSETQLYQSYIKTGIKKMDAIFKLLCIRVCDVSWCWFLCR